MPRALVDTNVWIAALINPTGTPAALARAVDAGVFILVTSDPLLAELDEVLQRPRIARRLRATPEQVSRFLTALAERAERVATFGTFTSCRDPDDNIVIETAIRGQADFLVTGDADLAGPTDLVQAIRGFGVTVIGPRAFLERLQAVQPS